MKSIYRLLSGLVTLVILAAPEHLCAQDNLRTHRIAGLRKLPEVALVLQPGDRNVELLTTKEIGDIVFVFLKTKIPSLKLARLEDWSSWLEVEYRTQTNGGLIRVALYRWVTISGTGESVLTTTWHNSLLVTGRLNRQDFKEALEEVLTSFAADYYRANP